MQLKPNVGSDRSWVYTAPHDLSEGTPTTELLAVRFANAENAGQFKTKFEEAQKINAAEDGGEGEQAKVPEKDGEEEKKEAEEEAEPTTKSATEPTTEPTTAEPVTEQKDGKTD